MAEYDLAVIGAGPGGYVAAIRAAQLGLKTVCIDARETLGGTCLNVGCIPSKALLQSTLHYEFLRKHAKDHGIECDHPTINFTALMSRKARIVESLVTGIAGLFNRHKIDWIRGIARFKSPHELVVGDQTIQTKNVIIATGSEPTPLPFLPFDEERIVSSTGILALKQIPKRLLVIGAGVIGVELASVYCRLGSETVVMEMLDQICPTMDADISKALQKSLKKQGIDFHLGVKVDQAKIESFAPDIVLVAVGRRPFTSNLGLDSVGIQPDKRGFIPVDQAFRTTQSHIYAVGDVIEGAMLAHKASEEGVAAVEIIAGLKPHINYLTIPNVIYTHPEVASVGLTSKEAQEAGLQVMTGSYMFRGNPRARCAGEEEGLVKIVGDSRSGRLLGMHIVGAAASEMIGEGVIAMEARWTVEQLANASHAHPTLCEAIKEAALDCLKRAIHL